MLPRIAITVSVTNVHEDHTEFSDSNYMEFAPLIALKWCMVEFDGSVGSHIFSSRLRLCCYQEAKP